MNVLHASEDFGYQKQILPFDEIYVNFGGEYKTLSEFAPQLAWWERHDGLMEHIQQHGLKNPIAVILKDGKYHWSGIGQARSQCAVKLGYTHIDCIILHDESEVRPLMIEQAKTSEKNYTTEPDNKWWEN